MQWLQDVADAGCCGWDAVAGTGCSGCGMWLMWNAVARYAVAQDAVSRDVGCCGWDVYE